MEAGPGLEIARITSTPIPPGRGQSLGPQLFLYLDSVHLTMTQAFPNHDSALFYTLVKLTPTTTALVRNF